MNVISIARRLIIAVLFACQLIQFFVEDTLINTVCTFIAFIASCVTILYVFDVRRFRRAPLSLLMILGFNVSALSGALVIQTASFRPIVFNLDVPLETFSSLFLTQLLVIVLGYFYSRSKIITAIRQKLTRTVFENLGLMKPPTDAELWIFGMVGCVVTMISAHNYTETIEYGDVSSKFALGYMPFVVAPFFIPMRAFVFGESSGKKARWLPILAYTVLLIVVAMANNARATFSSGFLTLGLCGLVAVLSGNLALTRKRIAYGLLMVGAGIPVFITLSDLATAMVIARDERSNVSSAELIEITLRNFQDKQLIEDRRHRDAVVSGGEYNENYIADPIFARFVYTKFVDVNMNNALRLSDGQAEEIRKTTRARILALLPTPVIRYFRLDIDKTELAFSSGDIYSYIARGLELGGYTTGSEIPDGLTIFGLLFWPVLSILVLVQFTIYDGFAKILPDGRLQVSALVLLNVVPIFTLGVMQESVSNQVISILRSIPQLILLYGLLRLCTIIALQPLTAVQRLGSRVPRDLAPSA